MSAAIKASRAKAGAMGGGAFMSRSQMRGDPGLFGDLWTGIKKIGGAAINVATGGLAGEVYGAVDTLFGKRRAAASAPTVAGPTINPVSASQAVPQGGPGGTLFAGSQPTGMNPPLLGPKGAGFDTPLGRVSYFENGNRSVPVNGNGAPSGYHLNKSDYFLKDGTFVPKGSRWVKNRRRNPLNARAASRAISRLESAKKATARINRITVRKAPCKR